jgi:NitT/TauT family transport system substrate-binding protein
MMHTRRQFLTTLSLAGAAGFVGTPPLQAAEGPPETTTVRLSNDLAICEAPMDIAAELLRAAGFTDVRHVDTSADDLSAAIAQRKVDFALDFPVLFAPAIDAGQPITALAGVHVGCFELFAARDVRTIADLKSKTVGCELAPAALLRLMARLTACGVPPSQAALLDPALCVVASADRNRGPGALRSRYIRRRHPLTRRLGRALAGCST